MRSRQPKVSTRTIIARQNEMRALNLLKESEEGMTPKAISTILNINRDTSKSMMRRLERQGRVIVRPDKEKGVYVLVDKGIDSIIKWKFQNTILDYKSNEQLTDKPIDINFNLDELINLRFMIGAKSNQATLFLDTKHCINLPAISLLGFVFTLLMKDYCKKEIKSERINFNTGEINNDHCGFRFDGVNVLTLRQAINDYKVYTSKEINGIREEFKIKQSLPLNFFEKLLIQGGVSAYTLGKIEIFEKRLCKVEKEKFKIEIKIKSFLDRVLKEMISIKKEIRSLVNSFTKR